ncbi:MAG TPA: hypothetical protein VFH73_24355 [Polyangia bacterium]|nr:hypothetical protein [Polyangia bacterium]
MNRKAMVLAVLFGGLAGCSGEEQVGEGVESVSSALLSNASVLGFESTSGWTITSGSIATSTTRSQGSFSIKTSGVTSASMTSQKLTTMAGASSTVGFDILLPTSQPNATYYGQLELHVNLPSQGVYDAFVGLKQLAPPFVRGSFQTISFTIPDWIFQKLRTASYSDLTWKFLISLPANNGGVSFDNLRFVSTAAPTTWPNSISSASSDAWLVANHASIQKLQPKVLVLNFDNTRDNAAVTTAVNNIIAGFKEGSRPRGYLDAAAPPMLEFQVAKVVDLRDHPAPAGWTKKTSTLLPRRANPGAFNWGIDYPKFYNATFAARYGFPDPAHPGQFLSLCQLADQGVIHDVWMAFDPDSDPGEASAAEILEWAPVYDANRVKTGGWDQCAGNGCFDNDVPHCNNASLRISFINLNRGPGCFIHGHGHGMEHKMSGGFDLPSVAPYFKEFADFDLDTKYGLPFDSWYALPADNPDPPEPNSPCDYIRWTGQTSIEWTNVPKPAVCTTQVPRTPLNPYKPVCGSVHFAPNARRHYDDFNTFTVLSSCQGWRRHEGAGGADQLRGFSLSTFSQYNSLAPDCEGGFQVWWRQNMPGFNSGLKDNASQPMLSWFPYLYY